MDSELQKKIERIESLCNVEKIIKKGGNSPKEIKRYYRINGAAYRKFHSDKGFMHFRISQGDSIEENDVYYQPDLIAGFIKDGMTVLELGPGQGANGNYLASSRPGASFIGVDLKPPKIKKSTPKNLRYITGDYKDLSAIESGSVDVAFGIETVVYSSEKDRVASEVFRTLKPGGVFICYDYSMTKELDEFLPYEQTALTLFAKCANSAPLESNKTWRSHFENAGFIVEGDRDYSKNILPDLRRLRNIARRIMDHDRRVKLLFGLFPAAFTNNVIIGYIGYDSYAEGLGLYDEWICRKPD